MLKFLDEFLLYLEGDFGVLELLIHGEFVLLFCLLLGDVEGSF